MPDQVKPRPAPFRVSVQAAILSGVRSLKEHRVEVPELTARLFLGDILQRDKAWLFAHSDDVLRPEDWDAFLDLIFSRCEGIPTQYVRGVQEFYGLEFQVTPDVLIPRPETEHAVEVALARLQPGDRVIDIGTGSGAIAVAIAKTAPATNVTASDLSAKAVRVARANAKRNAASVEFFVSDLAAAIQPNSFDVVVSNPPYVPRKDIGGLQRELRHEPSIALFGGEDGFEIYQRLVPEAAAIVKPGGWLIMELGYSSRAAIEELLSVPQWQTPEFHQDLAGLDRVVSVRRT